jgi:type IV pilus assembly protein PilA
MPAQPQQKKLSPYAIVALVLGGLACGCPPLWLGAIGFGIAAIVQIQRQPERYTGLPMAIGGMVVPTLMIPVVLAVAIPNYIRYTARSIQTECKVQLKSLYTAQKVLFADKGFYTESFHALDVEMPRGNRYLYALSTKGSRQDRGGSELKPLTPDTAQVGPDSFKHEGDPDAIVRALPSVAAGGVPLGISGTCPECDVTMACAGQADRDADVDIWSISTKDRVADDGTPIPAGIPYADHDDVTGR